MFYKKPVVIPAVRCSGSSTLCDLFMCAMRIITPVVWSCAVLAIIVFNGSWEDAGAWVLWGIATAFGIWVAIDRPL